MDVSPITQDHGCLQGAVTNSSPSQIAPSLATPRASEIGQPSLMTSQSADAQVSSSADAPNALLPTMWIATGRLCKLPLELRLNIYSFAYDDPAIDVIDHEELNKAPILASGLSIALAATCHFLRDELENYFARSIPINLRVHMKNTMILSSTRSYLTSFSSLSSRISPLWSGYSIFNAPIVKLPSSALDPGE
jgi:hypothetical protein